MTAQAAQSILVRNAIPQWFRLDPDQVQGNAGGFVWQISDQEQVLRYLVIGSEGGNYYQTPQQVSSTCASCILRMTRNPGNFKWLCETIRQVSIEGRVAKQESTLLALATIIVFAPTMETKQQALAVVPDCVRILTHMYMLTGYVKLFSKAGHPNLAKLAVGGRPPSITGSGFGRGIRRVFGQYFYSRTGGEIANLVTKYPNREGWTIKDVLTLIHIDPKKMKDDGGRLAIDWVFKTKEEFSEILKAANPSSPATTLFNALQEINQIANPPPGPNPSLHHLNSIITLADVNRVVGLITSAGLCREHLPSQFFKKREIWEALLTSKGVNGKGNGMPLTALIRNLGKLSTADTQIIESRISPDARASNRSVYYKVQTPTRSEQVYPKSHPAYYTEMIFHRLTNQQEIRRSRIHPYTILVAMLTYNKGHGDKGSLTWTPNCYILEALEFAFKLAFQNVAATGKRIKIALDVSGSMSSAFCTGSPIVNCATGSVAMMMMTLWVENQHRYKTFQDGAASASTAASADSADSAASAAVLAECAKWKVTQMPDGRTLYENSETKQCQFEKPNVLLKPPMSSHSNETVAAQTIVGRGKQSVDEYRKTKPYLGIPITNTSNAGRTQQFGYSSSFTPPPSYLPELYPAPAIPSNVTIGAFSNTYIDLTNAIVGFMDASIDPATGIPTMTIADALKLVDMPFSSTDCALPIVEALKRREPVDAFVVYTDSETYMGTIHPQAALEQYRSEMGMESVKLIVVGMTSNCLTIADPKDLNTLNLAGFDTATPRIISDFIGGSIAPIGQQCSSKSGSTESGGAAGEDAEEFVML